MWYHSIYHAATGATITYQERNLQQVSMKKLLTKKFKNHSNTRAKKLQKPTTFQILRLSKISKARWWRRLDRITVFSMVENPWSLSQLFLMTKLKTARHVEGPISTFLEISTSLTMRAIKRCRTMKIRVLINSGRLGPTHDSATPGALLATEIEEEDKFTDKSCNPSQKAENTPENQPHPISRFQFLPPSLMHQKYQLWRNRGLNDTFRHYYRTDDSSRITNHLTNCPISCGIITKNNPALSHLTRHICNKRLGSCKTLKATDRRHTCWLPSMNATA